MYRLQKVVKINRIELSPVIKYMIYSKYTLPILNPISTGLFLQIHIIYQYNRQKRWPKQYTNQNHEITQVY